MRLPLSLGSPVFCERFPSPVFVMVMVPEDVEAVLPTKVMTGFVEVSELSGATPLPLRVTFRFPIELPVSVSLVLTLMSCVSDPRLVGV